MKAVGKDEVWIEIVNMCELKVAKLGEMRKEKGKNESQMREGETKEYRRV